MVSKGQALIKIVSILVVIGLGVGCRGDGRGVESTVSGTSGLCSGRRSRSGSGDPPHLAPRGYRRETGSGSILYKPVGVSN